MEEIQRNFDDFSHPDVEAIAIIRGCLLGQLCPPSMLIAMTLLEALFFRQHGIRSVSLSYAQGTSMAQDIGALQALRENWPRTIWTAPTGMSWSIPTWGSFPPLVTVLVA